MTDNSYHLTIWQGGMEVASVDGEDFERVHAEAMHYAFQYAQDGPIEIRGIPSDKMDWLTSKLGPT